MLQQLSEQVRECHRHEPYLRKGEPRVQIDGPTLMLEPQTAQAVAVALHELATNASKYGALSDGKGRVEVAWSCATDGQLSLRWTENGGPPVKTPTRQGFAAELIAVRSGRRGGRLRDSTLPIHTSA